MDAFGVFPPAYFLTRPLGTSPPARLCFAEGCCRGCCRGRRTAPPAFMMHLPNVRSASHWRDLACVGVDRALRRCPPVVARVIRRRPLGVPPAFRPLAQT
jgi:hypothetical protein